MTDEVKVEKPAPVDTSHLDAGVAARESAKTPKPEPKQEVKAEVEEVGAEDPQNDPEASAAEEPEDTPGQPRKGVGKRIDELTKARREAERERDHWREMAMRAQQPQSVTDRQEPAKPKVSEDKAPELADFDYDMQAWVDAFSDWKVKQVKVLETKQQREAKFNEKLESFAKDKPDFRGVVQNPHLPISQAMVEIVKDSDSPGEILYYLGQNPQEAAAIAQMSEVSAARALGRIEAKLSEPKPTPAVVNPKPVTKAPPPVKTLSGAPPIEIDLSSDDISPEEYSRQRRADRKARGLA